MIDNILINKNLSIRTKITIKTLISISLIILSVCLPQIAHLIIKNQSGIKLLPMYFPILIGGCLLGIKYGLFVSIFSPIMSYLFTSLLNNPMPTLERLPFMIVELSIFAIITGLFSKKIAKNPYLSFIAVILAFIVGRSSFLLLATIFQNMVSFTPTIIFNQIKMGYLGVIIQTIIVPLIIILIQNKMIKETNND